MYRACWLIILLQLLHVYKNYLPLSLMWGMTFSCDEYLQSMNWKRNEITAIKLLVLNYMKNEDTANTINIHTKRYIDIEASDLIFLCSTLFEQCNATYNCLSNGIIYVTKSSLPSLYIHDTCNLRLQL